ncbi:Rossmann-like and DUF2520 domain-containing protein [Winogradskyella psychrotolerans]|uniref:Rossmann-like and DUF2520 domain-containing protein n=1 Tax=Winogradskyella psychrotolerans TaxID=1344585 RepID=UPI001C07B668|nr:DUF2520 domain-containing protein [Winogradskyella psychrotolerans]MBU2928644.1 DUF2520 domain-containing protein [Winogradskyella psychrotolerans]
MISVILLGAGNVATHLYKAFSNAENVSVKQWYNRTRSSISSYANDVDITDSLNELKEADLYIMAVSDDSIAELSSALPFTNRLVVHTSGSVAMHDLDKKNQIGVFYPLQTFSKAADIDFSEVPICVEVYEKENLELLRNLARAVGCKPHKITTEQRQTLHLAAVFVNNFTNQLYRIGHEICETKNIEFNILHPLIEETAKKIQQMSPFIAQTGPAKRNDKKTIKRQLKLIEKEEHEAIYKLLTSSIKKTHHVSNFRPRKGKVETN